MKKISQFMFRNRSYTPAPLLILSFLYLNANVWSLIFGFSLALFGELIRLWGVGYAGSETRTTGEVGGTYLIISGPFSRLRNPLYLGNMMIYFGIGIMAFALFPYLQIIGVLFFLFQYYYIVREEEGFLRNKFGEDYSHYFDNVPRFIPRVTKYRNEKLAQPKFNLKAGLRSEKRTLQAFALVTAVIITIWIIRRY